MIGWICYLVSRLKAAWKALEEAAERQTNRSAIGNMSLVTF